MHIVYVKGLIETGQLRVEDYLSDGNSKPMEVSLCSVLGNIFLIFFIN